MVVVGGLVGAASAGVATYYIEHHEADALQDVTARNRQLAEALAVYDSRYKHLDGEVAELRQRVSQYAEISDQQSVMFKDVLTKQRVFEQQISEAVGTLTSQLADFRSAVIAKFDAIPPEIAHEIEVYSASIGQLKTFGAGVSGSEQDTTEFMRKKGWL
jgi:chromosome segregation ATPase